MKYKEEFVKNQKNKSLTLENEEVDVVYRLIGKISMSKAQELGLTQEQTDLLVNVYREIFHYPRF